MPLELAATHSAATADPDAGEQLTIAACRSSSGSIVDKMVQGSQPQAMQRTDQSGNGRGVGAMTCGVQGGVGCAARGWHGLHKPG
jgi:hypothetical protein